MDLNAVRKFIKQIGTKVWEFVNTPDASGKSVLDRTVTYLKDEALRFKTTLTTENIKIAMSYEEHAFTSLTFEEFLKRVKSAYSLVPGDRLCVLKTVKNDVTLLDVMSVNVNDDVCFSSASPWCRFIVANLDVAMESMFNNKDMLVLK